MCCAASKGQSSAARQITTFSGVSRPGSFSRNPSSPVPQQNEPVNNASADPEVLEKRKPTRVPTKQGNKKDAVYSPVPAEKFLGHKAGQAMELQDLDLDDYEVQYPVVPYRKKVSVDADSNPPERDEGEFGNENDIGRVASSVGSDLSGVSSSSTADGTEFTRRRTGAKSLGWGDKKPPPLNYRPWYSIWSW